MANHAIRFGLLLTALHSFAAFAATIIAPNQTENVTPAGDSFMLSPTTGRMQNIYAQSQFDSLPSDIVNITEVRFQLYLGQPDFVSQATGLRILMSTTSVGPDAMTLDFSQNLGAGTFEALPTGDYAITGTRSGSSFGAVIPLPRPYTFDRRNGNLAVDIQWTDSALNTAWEMRYYDASQGPVAARAIFSRDLNRQSATAMGGAMLTEFGFEVVPEPASPRLLLMAGVLCAGWFRARRGLRPAGTAVHPKNCRIS